AATLLNDLLHRATAASAMDDRRSRARHGPTTRTYHLTPDQEQHPMSDFANRRRAVSSPGRSRPARDRRRFRPGPEALDTRALLSTDLDPRLIDVNKAGIGANPSNFTSVGGTTYFLATDRASGQELYRTDGSVKGTRLVKDINPGPASSNIHDMTALNGLLLFFANDGKNGEELRRSDGTKEGTRLV